MPLNKINTNNKIPNIVTPKNGNQRKDCYKLIAKLDFTDLGRGARTLYTVNQVRLDMQGRTTAGGANIQVQIGNSTAAAVVIFGTALQTQDPANQRGVVNAVISVLNQSLDKGTIWHLTGQL